MVVKTTVGERNGVKEHNLLPLDHSRHLVVIILISVKMIMKDFRGFPVVQLAMPVVGSLISVKLP